MLDALKICLSGLFFACLALCGYSAFLVFENVLFKSLTDEKMALFISLSALFFYGLFGCLFTALVVILIDQLQYRRMVPRMIAMTPVARPLQPINPK